MGKTENRDMGENGEHGRKEMAKGDMAKMKMTEMKMSSW